MRHFAYGQAGYTAAGPAITFFPTAEQLGRMGSSLGATGREGSNDVVLFVSRRAWHGGGLLGRWLELREALSSTMAAASGRAHPSQFHLEPADDEISPTRPYPTGLETEYAVGAGRSSEAAGLRR